MMLGWFFKRQSEVKNNKAEVGEKYTGPKTALSDYLQYYSCLSAPGYAVLVTGAWGTGKTYQVKQVMKEFGYYYVSLYGVDSVSGIHDAVLAECLPSLKAGTKLTSMIKEVSKDMGGPYAVAGVAGDAWKILLRRYLSSEKTIIFDDLERSALWDNNKKSELLGAINQYVEHKGFRVITICHDEKIEEQLNTLKEKTFGHTVMAQPQIEAALLDFINSIENNNEREFITKYKGIIKDIFLQSGQSSLRILKYLINDIARLRAILHEKHSHNESAMIHLLKFFCALNIDFRSGVIGRHVLVHRQEYAAQEWGEQKDGAINGMIERYPDTDILGSILSEKLVKEMVIKGKFDAVALELWLDQTHYFIQVKEAKPWRIVLNFDKLEDDVLSDGLERMQKQFDERQITNMGELMHIVFLRLMMVQQGVLSHGLEDEKKLCFEYIDDLVNSGRMPPKVLPIDEFGAWDDVYDGTRYWGVEEHYKFYTELREYINKAEMGALEKTYTDHLSRIYNLMTNDAASVRSIITLARGGNDGLLAEIPIFSNSSAKLFLDNWLSGPRSGWRQITIALDERYKHGRLKEKLHTEEKWLSQLNKEFDTLIDSSEGLTAYRLKRLKPKIFESVSKSGQKLDLVLP